ncbi:MAG TPA: hypothetical protein VMR98_01955 [Candidatus Polarisedimenticolaceae bacterium]|nr:hypothetical protein [Candidatus Polarisedimenticolaceae bacterium]
MLRETGEAVIISYEPGGSAPTGNQIRDAAKAIRGPSLRGWYSFNDDETGFVIAAWGFTGTILIAADLTRAEIPCELPVYRFMVMSSRAFQGDADRPLFLPDRRITEVGISFARRLHEQLGYE